MQPDGPLACFSFVPALCRETKGKNAMGKPETRRREVERMLVDGAAGRA